MHYYLYKITNIVNNKIYIGVHKTNNLNDSYMGSGTALKDAKLKYGINCFKKEIIEFFDSEEKMYKREKEVVNLNFVEDRNNYNLSEGGNSVGTIGSSKGGLKTFNENLGIFSEEAYKKRIEYLNSNQHKEHLLKWSKSEECKNNMRINSKLSLLPENIEKRKRKYKEIKHAQGKNNSQFGKMWINDGTNNKVINKTDIIPQEWVKGRIRNFTEEQIEVLKENGRLSKGKHIWINDGTKNKFYKSDEIIPDGWVKGRLNIFKKL